jgi:cell division protein FtsB
MIAADQWYEYQKQYRKFSFNMKPVESICESEKKKSRTTPRDRLSLIVLTVIMGLIFVGLIIVSAYGANIKYDINNLAKENAVIQGEIENLNVKIKCAVNIGNVEERAINELGMVYPEVDQFRYLAPEQSGINNLALAIKENAYN